jgi:hypothetical protein
LPIAKRWQRKTAAGREGSQARTHRADDTIEGDQAPGSDDGTAHVIADFIHAEIT